MATDMAAGSPDAGVLSALLASNRAGEFVARDRIRRFLPAAPVTQEQA